MTLGRVLDGLCSREQRSMDNDTLFHKLDGDTTNAHFIILPRIGHRHCIYSFYM